MEPKIKNSCYIGCRISTPKQAQEGESLEEQEKVCRLHSTALGFDVIKVYKDQHSATKAGSSFMDEIIQDIKKQPINKRGSHFLITAIDRFCRAGTTEYTRLKNSLEELNIQLIDAGGVIQPKINSLAYLGVSYKWSVYSPSEGSEMMEAHKSKRVVGENLTRMIGKEINLVREGYKVRPPNDGFENKKIFVEGKKKVIQEPDPKRAPFFIKMFEMSVTHTDQEIVDYLNAIGYRSKEQNKWSKSRDRVIGFGGSKKLTIKHLQAIRQRTIYAGINTEKWLLGKATRTKYDGLISIDTFNKANRGKIFIEEKKDGSIFVHKDYNPHQLKRMRDNPLFPHKAVVLCPICQKPFLGSSPKGKYKSIPTYHCARDHKYYGVNKVEFEKQLTTFVSGLKYKNKAFFKTLEATLINKFREKEKELGEFSVKVGKNVIELQTEKNQKIEAYTSTKNEIIRASLEKQIEDIHTQLEEAKSQRNNLDVQENDIHAFVRYVKYLMEHPIEMLIKQEDLPALKSLFGLVFKELPTYKEILNGTPKLSIAYKLSEEFRTNKSLSVTLQGIEP